MKCPCCGKDGYNVLTLARLKQSVSYDPETGVFTWLKVTRPSLVGKPAGAQKYKYCFFSVNGKRYYAHRLAWFYMTGKWPVSYIDHINGNSQDNRWANLREATPSQNNANKSKNRFSRSGFKGASWTTRTGKWRAVITVRGKQKHLGSFDTAKAAHEAYIAAAIKHFGIFARAG